jgi:hypothetical protein
MKFHITKIIGLIGVLAFLFWMSVMVLSPIEVDCTVDYYGKPNVMPVAESILNLQIASYDTDYNYHRALDADTCSSRYGAFNCELSGEIDYYGAHVLNGEVTKKYAIDSIEYQIQRVYETMGVAELQISWEARNLIIVPTLEGGFEIPDYANDMDENNSYVNCVKTLDVSNILEIETGDTIKCYVPPFNADSCEVSITKYKPLEGFTAFCTYLTATCLTVVIIVTVIAIATRLYKRHCIRKMINVAEFHPSAFEEGDGDSDTEPENSDDGMIDDDQGSHFGILD